jgi:hypothetical protein
MIKAAAYLVLYEPVVSLFRDFGQWTVLHVQS